MRPNRFKEGMEWCNKLFVTGVGPTVSVKRSVSIVEPILAHTCEVFSIHLQEMRIAVNVYFYRRGAKRE